MQFLDYALASVTAYSGLIVGMLLIFMGPEEKKPGIKYFIIMQKIVFLLILFFFFFHFKLNIYLLFVLMAIFSWMLFYVKGTEKAERQYIIYTLLGIIFYLSSKEISFFVTEVSLIFIYGLPTGSLLTESSKKKRFKSFKRILRYSYFIIAALALQILFSNL